jgi:hypothetical protein
VGIGKTPFTVAGVRVVMGGIHATLCMEEVMGCVETIVRDSVGPDHMF